MFRKHAAVLISLFCFSALGAQNDSAAGNGGAEAAPKERLRLFSFAAEPHSAKKATIYSAVIPGLGQIYNQKYWKAPIVWAAMGATAWYMYDQRRQMRVMNDSFRFHYAIDPKWEPTAEQRQKRDGYRKGRDIGILALTGLYVIQIVDAAVDAHFFRFDINQSLSAELKPNSYQMFCVQYRF